jgi:hypothetical protein
VTLASPDASARVVNAMHSSARRRRDLTIGRPKGLDLDHPAMASVGA